MRLTTTLAAMCTCLALQAAFLTGAAAAEPGAPAKASEAAYDCKADKAKTTVCKRTVSQELRKQCRWRCSTSCPHGQCVEICRGSGQECNGKTPPGW